MEIPTVNHQDTLNTFFHCDYKHICVHLLSGLLTVPITFSPCSLKTIDCWSWKQSFYAFDNMTELIRQLNLIIHILIMFDFSHELPFAFGWFIVVATNGC